MKLNSNLFMLNVSKDEIINKKMFRVRTMIKELEKDIESNYKSLHILFDGFNSDPREIYEIEEIRNFCIVMMKKFPQIFYFLEDKLEGRQNVLLCISDVLAFRKGEYKSIEEIYQEDPSTFVERQESLPKTEIKLDIPKNIYQTIEKGIVEWGNTKKVSQQVDKVMIELKEFVR